MTRIEELQGQLEVAQGTSRGPIAVIGMACRFPGGAIDPQSYWQLLQDQVDAVREVPADRWDVEEYFDPDPKTRGKTYSRWGGYLDRVDEFDAQFFGIPPREAATLDPQHRLVLEVTWEALENAGLAPTKLAGTQTGVFVGITISEYLQLIHKSLLLENLDAYQASGNTLNAAAGRVVLLSGSQRSDDGPRHRLLVLSGRCPSRVAKPARPETATWPWPGASTCSWSPRPISRSPSGGCSHPLAAVGHSMPPRMVLSAPRAAALSSSSASRMPWRMAIGCWR